MATAKHRSLSEEEAPDTARVYERARPEAEGGMGRLDNNKGTPTSRADKIEHAVTNKHSSHQLNYEDAVNAAGGPVCDPNSPRRKTRHDVADEKRKARRRGAGGA